MTQRRGGRPRGPARVPFTTTLRPEALAALRARSVAVHKTARAVNRVIEEDVMGLAAVQWSETEDVTLTFTRAEWEDEATVTVRLCANDNDEIEAVSWHSVGSGPLTEDEEQRARDAARRKAAES